MSEVSGWPKPPREPGPWSGGPPVAPPGNTPLPPLPGPGGVSRTSAGGTNPWANAESVPGPGFPPGGPFPGLNAGARPRVDRAPRWIIGLSTVVVVALALAAAYVVIDPGGGKSYPKEWDARVAPIAAWVATHRKLAFEHKVEVEFLSAAEYKAASTGGDAVETDESKQALEDAAAQLRALGLVEGKVDLGAAGDTLADSGTLAYYDPASEKIYVRGTKVTPALRVTLAHELTHVLQDQHFDLERIEDLPDSQAPVLRALAEGDATRIEDAYVADELSAADRTSYEAESKTSGDEATKEVDDKVPAAMTAFFASPYIFGPRLVAFLEATGGDEAIDGALETPPTEAVLFDPLIYKTDAAKSSPIEVPAPKGTTKIEDGEFGATAWYLLLASRMDARVALTATDGLGDDGYVVYRDDDVVCVRALVKGDTAADTDQLKKALDAWVAKSPKGKAEVASAGGQVRFRSCDPGTAVTGASKVTVDLLGVPATRTDIYNQVVKAGIADEQASCYANGIVQAFTAAQLNDEKYASSAPAVAAIDAVKGRCL